MTRQSALLDMGWRSMSAYFVNIYIYSHRSLVLVLSVCLIFWAWELVDCNNLGCISAYFR
jgi:hypothetical protein